MSIAKVISMKIKAYFADWEASLFPFWYFLLAALSSNSLTAGKSYILIPLIAVTLFYAAARFLMGFFRLIDPNRLPIGRYCLCFAASFVVSMMAAREYGLMGNLKTLAWLSLCLFVLYPSGVFERFNPRKIYKVKISTVFMNALMAYTGIQALISFGLWAARYNTYRPVNIYTGFWYGRLWGSYADPNYGAMLSLASVMIALMYLVRGMDRTWKKVLLIVHIVLEYLYITASYSRGGIVVMTVAMLLFFLYWSMTRRPGLVKGALVAVLLIAMCFGTSTVRSAYNKLANSLNAEILENTGDPSELLQELNRDEASIMAEITSGRVAIWKNGVDILKKNMLFGISYRNILPYLRDQMPDCYMVTHNEPLSTCHNALIDVMVSQGLLGMGLLIAAFISAVLISLKGWKELDSEGRDEAMTYGLTAITILGGSMFLSDVFYLNTATTVAFWYLFGQWMACMVSGQLKVWRQEDIDDFAERARVREEDKARRQGKR